jgi:hypothetical protein
MLRAKKEPLQTRALLVKAAQHRALPEVEAIHPDVPIVEKAAKPETSQAETFPLRAAPAKGLKSRHRGRLSGAHRAAHNAPVRANL